ncbi:MAG: hypothetical protein ACPLRL_08060, partial [Thermodesulfovibrio sp.]
AVRNEMKAYHEATEKRFEAMDKRFEAVRNEMKAYHEATEKRFEAMDKRFEAIDKRIQFLQWFMGAGFTFITILIGIFGLLRH